MFSRGIITLVSEKNYRFIVCLLLLLVELARLRLGVRPRRLCAPAEALGAARPLPVSAPLRIPGTAGRFLHHRVCGTGARRALVVPDAPLGPLDRVAVPRRSLVFWRFKLRSKAALLTWAHRVKLWPSGPWARAAQTTRT